MKKAMISQPMAGKSDEEILAVRKLAVEFLEKEGYEVVNTLFSDEWTKVENMKDSGIVQIPVHFLAKSLEAMATCDAVYFCKGWEETRGCRIEHEVAVAYGLTVLSE